MKWLYLAGVVAILLAAAAVCFWAWRTAPSDDDSVHAPMTRLAGFRAVTLVLCAVAIVVVFILDS